MLKDMSVSSFQSHIIDRIRLHAERVESFRLGSAAHIRDELEDKLSQVWALARHNDEVPLAIPQDRLKFDRLIQIWLQQTGPGDQVVPEIDDKRVDLYQMYAEVEGLGGPENVHAMGLWHLIAIKMGYASDKEYGPQLSAIAEILADAYRTFIIPFKRFCIEDVGPPEETTDEKPELAGLSGGFLGSTSREDRAGSTKFTRRAGGYIFPYLSPTDNYVSLVNNWHMNAYNQLPLEFQEFQLFHGGRRHWQAVPTGEQWILIVLYPFYFPP
jgi:hypothetical protein